MKKLLFLPVWLYSLSVSAISFHELWSLSAEKNIPVQGERKITPQQFQLAQLDMATFQLFQSHIPMEADGKAETIFLPTPDGNSMEFRVYEKPMMESGLYQRYPQIKTYTALGVSNPRVMAKLDYTLFGFHAMILDGEQTYFIDPLTNGTQEWYQIYYKKDYRRNLSHSMICEVKDEELPQDQGSAIPLAGSSQVPALSYKTNGDTIRNYRLALACTEEYSAAVGGATPTKASVLSAMVTSMNRCNGVFEKDLSMHANLVNNEDTIIYLPGSGDPYTNNSGSTMLGENQTNLTSLIGTANYDYGHVFSTGGGGIAQLGCVCNSGSKAQGVTGSSNPVGDAFDIDYVVHEMGHQFGGQHTFNSVNGSCGGGNRSATSAYEIGSATTIMGYAGICGTDDIQPHSDDYYHIRSLEQMTGTSVKACASNTLSNNNKPVLAAISNTYIVPWHTDFELSTTATDADNDPLSYCWEEYDRGGNGGTWDAATTVAPILRSFNPDSTGTRVFPQYKELIKNTDAYLGERLPDTNRIVRFRCTVRDMHNGYGAFYTSTDTVKLDVRKTTTYYRVTSQATAGQSWNGFSTQTITWDVAGTNAAPFNVSNVTIYLSVDSGRTWPYVLAPNTPNDGTETIGVPNVAAQWARVKVKAAGNVFFDLNDNWIEIKKIVSPAGLSSWDEETVKLYPNPSTGLVHVQLPAGLTHVAWSCWDVMGKEVATGLMNDTGDLNLAALAKGLYMIRLQSDAIPGTLQRKVVIE